MKKNNLIENLNKEYKALIDKFGEINFYKSMIHKTKKSKYRELKKQQEMYQTLQLDTEPISMTQFSYRDMSGFLQTIGFIEKNIDELLVSIDYHHNRQYQLLLVSAFESYIKFVETSYTIIKNYNVEILALDKEDKFAYYNVIKQLRNRIDGFIECENGSFFNKSDNEESGKNYLFLMQMIKEFRDAIVHQQGENTSVDKIYEEILKHRKNDLLIDDIKKYKEEIAIYFGNHEYANMICLSEIYKNNCKYTCRLSILLGTIIAYASFLNKSFIRLVSDAKEATLNLK